MATVNISEAKRQLSRLVERASRGEDIIIARNGTPVARLTTLAEKKAVRFGVLAGKVRVSEDFDAPLPEDVITG